MSGNIGVVVGNNNLGQPYVSNIADPGTLSFSNQSYPASSGEGSSISFLSSSGAGLGSINFAITNFSAHSVSAVPEPETYAMMLAGLGVIGAVARRRKAKQS